MIFFFKKKPYLVLNAETPNVKEALIWICWDGGISFCIVVNARMRVEQMSRQRYLLQEANSAHLKPIRAATSTFPSVEYLNFNVFSFSSVRVLHKCGTWGEKMGTSPHVKSDAGLHELNRAHAPHPAVRDPLVCK